MNIGGLAFLVDFQPVYAQKAQTNQNKGFIFIGMDDIKKDWQPKMLMKIWRNWNSYIADRSVKW